MGSIKSFAKKKDVFIVTKSKELEFQINCLKLSMRE